VSDIDMNEWNRQIIEEFRANEGRVGGQFEGAPMVLLTTTGAKSGLPRTTPLMYLPDGDRIVIFASKAGAPTHPDWYHNIVTNPTVTLEVGTETFAAEATIAEGDERQALFDRQIADYPGFGDYVVSAAPRVIPVVILKRKG